MKQKQKQVSNDEKSFLIDLAEIEGDGSFKCPKCGMSISPEDETEDNYKIVDTKVKNDELVELVINCGKCESTLRLTGFQQTVDA
jgi:predicted RNA-binding Zn-ribbon protein involved in translation (DUF1610 family)